MDSSHDFFQYLIPIIFLMVWAIGRVFGGKKKEPSSQTASVEEETIYNPFEEELIEFPRGEKTVSQEILTTQQARKTNKPTSSKQVYSNEMKVQKPANQRANLLALLSDRQSIKKAVLVSEVLGPPVSLRRNGKMGHPT